MSGWPLDQYGPRNTCYNPTTSGPSGPVKEAWSTTLATRQSIGQPRGGETVVVQDGTLYTTNGGGIVQAIDTGDGSEVWSRTIALQSGNKRPTIRSLAVMDGRVFVPTGARGSLLTLDANTGETLWETDSTDEGVENPQRYDTPVKGSPTVVDGTVYVGDNRYNIYALDAATGERIWVYTGIEPNRRKINYQLAVHEGLVYTARQALDAETGEIVWDTELPPENSLGGDPTIHGDDLWALRTYALRQLDLKTGEQRSYHGYETDVRTSGSPVAGEGHIYFASKTRKGTVYALPNDPEKISAYLEQPAGRTWQKALAAWQTSSFQGGVAQFQASIADGVLYIRSSLKDRGYLYGVDAATGQRLFEFETSVSSFSSAPIIVDGTIYISTHDGKLFALSEK
ncbi:outer membrane protein assembly factor BamB family protein [Halovenus salina]|uniref:outer membrane protein assembly factor BamB family protein n=1 Tax=Halovenus salina TaxID=1510225 RepID=UPI002260D623|nr:PQQ-binding-like beta-propeller repeat protein [Halovenus salina]